MLHDACMPNDTVALPPNVSTSKNADGISRRSLFKCGLLGMLSGFFGIGKLLANPTNATDETLDPQWLAKWRSASRIPVWESSDPTVCAIVSAILLNQSITISYFGGSSPGESRVTAPSLVFTCDGYSGTWVSAYCQTRGQQRMFRADRITLS